jgi:hypothetical protein
MGGCNADFDFMILGYQMLSKQIVVTCGAMIVKAMFVVRVRLPEDPAMVIGKVPVVALGPTLKVKTLVAAVGLVPNEVVTPFGIPDELSFTLPVNPRHQSPILCWCRCCSGRFAMDPGMAESKVRSHRQQHGCSRGYIILGVGGCENVG